MLYLSFKFVRKFKFCVSPLVKRYPVCQIQAGTCPIWQWFMIMLLIMLFW